MAEVPAGKQINGFTGELEDAAPLFLNPSPAHQRILAMNGSKPLAQLCADVVTKEQKQAAKEAKNA